MWIFMLSLPDERQYREKFDEIYMLYRAKMFAVAREITKNDNDAEDIVHAVFLNIAEKHMPTVARIENSSELCNYLLIAVKNTARNYVRDNKRLFYYEDTGIPESRIISDDECFAEYINTKNEYERVLNAMRQMDDTYRDVLYLHFVMEMKSKEIAKLLNRSNDAVRKQIIRGKKILIAALNGDDSDG